MAHEEPEDPSDQTDPAARQAAEDDAWRDIVAHFGEQADITDAPATEAEPTERPAAVSPIVATPFGDDIDEEPDWAVDDDLLLPGAFIAPDPEGPAWAGWRSVAWIGVLGSPALALVWTFVTILTGWHTPTWMAYLVIGAFLGSFGYLVATMPKEREDPWDDGAQV